MSDFYAELFEQVNPPTNDVIEFDAGLLAEYPEIETLQHP
jgi:hypothetical protein